jgi:hypothetical protein
MGIAEHETSERRLVGVDGVRRIDRSVTERIPRPAEPPADAPLVAPDRQSEEVLQFGGRSEPLAPVSLGQVQASPGRQRDEIRVRGTQRRHPRKAADRCRDRTL